MANAFREQVAQGCVAAIAGLSIAASANLGAAFLLPEAKTETRWLTGATGAFAACLAIAGGSQMREKKLQSWNDLANQLELAKWTQLVATGTVLLSAAVVPNVEQWPYKPLNQWFLVSAAAGALCNRKTLIGLGNAQVLASQEIDQGLEEEIIAVAMKQAPPQLRATQAPAISVPAQAVQAPEPTQQRPASTPPAHPIATPQEPLKFASQKAPQADTNVIEQLASTHLSIVTSAPPGTGKTCTGLAWLAYVFEKFPRAIVLVASWKNDSFLGLNRLISPNSNEPGAVTVLDGIDFTPLLTQLNRALQIMQQRKDTPKEQRNFEDQPVWVFLDDYYATIQCLTSSKSNREIWNEIKIKMAIIATVGREFFVGFNAFTHSLVLAALGLTDSNVRHCLNVCGQGKISRDESGRIDGGYDAIYSAIRNPNIVGDAEMREQLLAQLSELIKESEATGRPIFFTTMGHPPTLTLLDDLRWTETYKLSDEIIASLAERTGFIVRGQTTQISPIDKWFQSNCQIEFTSIQDWYKPENIAKLPSYPGIYLVGDDERTPYYVGESTNLRQRWSGTGQFAHHWLPGIEELLSQGKKIYISWHLTLNHKDDEERAIAEISPLWNNRNPLVVVNEMQQLRRLEINTTPLVYDSTIDPDKLQKVIEFSQKHGWLNAAKVKAGIWCFRSETPETIRRYFMELSRQGKGHLKGESDALEWSIEADSLN